MKPLHAPLAVIILIGALSPRSLHAGVVVTEASRRAYAQATVDSFPSPTELDAKSAANFEPAGAFAGSVAAHADFGISTEPFSDASIEYDSFLGTDGFWAETSDTFSLALLSVGPAASFTSFTLFVRFTVTEPQVFQMAALVAPFSAYQDVGLYNYTTMTAYVPPATPTIDLTGILQPGDYAVSFRTGRALANADSPLPDVAESSFRISFADAGDPNPTPTVPDFSQTGLLLALSLLGLGKVHRIRHTAA